MRSEQVHIRWLIAAASAALLAVALAPAAAARQTASTTSPADGWAMKYEGVTQAGSHEEFIPGVTDSTFIPGVTDSTTGVMRELERRGLEPQAIPSSPSVDDSGFHWNDAVLGMGAVLGAAALMTACAALLAGERRRRRPAI